MEWSQSRCSNPNGIVSSSPRLRGTSDLGLFRSCGSRKMVLAARLRQPKISKYNKKQFSVRSVKSKFTSVINKMKIRLSLLTLILGGHIAAASLTISPQGIACRVASSPSGDWVVVWEEDDGTGKADIFASIYNISGTPLVQRIPVDNNAAATGSTPFPHEANPKVGMDIAGNFVVSWDSRDTAQMVTTHFRRYNRATSSFGNVVEAISAANHSGDYHSLSMAPDGRFALAQVSSDYRHLHVLRYSAAGLLEDDRQINPGSSESSYSCVRPTIGLKTGGGFVLFWKQTDRHGSPTFGSKTLWLGRVFDANAVATKSYTVFSRESDTSDYSVDPIDRDNVEIGTSGKVLYSFGQTKIVNGTYAEESFSLFETDAASNSLGTITFAGPVPYFSLILGFGFSTALFADGSYEAVWAQIPTLQGAPTGSIQSYNAGGVVRGSKRPLREDPGFVVVTSPATAVLSTNSYVAVWREFDGTSQNYKIVARIITRTTTGNAIPILSIRKTVNPIGAELSFEVTADKHYTIMDSGDLKSFSVVEQITGQAGNITRAYQLSESNRFFKVRVGP